MSSLRTEDVPPQSVPVSVGPSSGDFDVFRIGGAGDNLDSREADIVFVIEDSKKARITLGECRLDLVVQ